MYQPSPVLGRTNQNTCLGEDMLGSSRSTIAVAADVLHVILLTTDLPCPPGGYVRRTAMCPGGGAMSSPGLQQVEDHHHQDQQVKRSAGQEHHQDQEVKSPAKPSNGIAGNGLHDVARSTDILFLNSLVTNNSEVQQHQVGGRTSHRPSTGEESTR